MKKWVCCLAAVLLLWGLGAFPSARVWAAPDSLRIEQVQVHMPSIRAYFYPGEQGLGQKGIEATLGARSLQLAEEDPANGPVETHYMFLVDCSTSTTAAQMQSVKTALGDFVQNPPENASVSLLTFGVSVDVVLEREKDPRAWAAALDNLAANQRGTLFFDALAKAIEIAGKEGYIQERKLAFVFSDSVDYNLGGYTKDEIETMLWRGGLPMYALGFDTGGKEQLDNFGAVARASGGKIAVVSPQELPAAFAALVEETQNVVVADFDAGSNIATMDLQDFTLTRKDTGQKAFTRVLVDHWQPDTQAPRMESVRQLSPDSLEITFSEPVSGAGSLESYVIQTGQGQEPAPMAVDYDEQTRTARITLSRPPETDQMEIFARGVTDDSMEHNGVEGSIQLDFVGQPPAEAPKPPPPEAPLGAWIVAGLLGAAALIALALGVSRGKKNRAQLASAAPAAVPAPGVFTAAGAAAAPATPQVHFEGVPQALPRIRLDVTGPDGKGHQIEMPIDKSLFVGRSDICDIYFDDRKMSRQHFVISEKEGRYTLTNLSQTGGTRLNGIRIDKTRPLQAGDTIEAADQKLVFFIGRQGGA